MRIFSLIALFLGCGFFANAQHCSTEFTSPEEAATFIVQHILSNDQEGVQCVMSETELEKLQSKKDWKVLFAKGQELFAGVDKVEEVKLGPPVKEGVYGFICKVKEEGDDVITLIITSQGDKFFYDGISTLPKAQYGLLPSIK